MIARFLAPPRCDLVFVLDGTGVIFGGHTEIVLHVHDVSKLASEEFDCSGSTAKREVVESL